MDFKTAAFTCLRLKYANFSDRASRSEYWWFMLLNSISAVVLGIIMVFIGSMINSSAGETIFAILMLIAIVAWIIVFFIPSLAVSVRRFHDLDMTGWWLLIFWAMGAIPVLGTIASIVNLVLFCKQGTEGPNRFGNNPFAIDDYQETFR